MYTSDNKRPSAMKVVARVDPLLGSPVQAAPFKTARTGEAVAMAEDALAAVPDFPVGSSGSMAPNQFFTTPLVIGDGESDSLPEHSYPCGACYLASCEYCGLLPSVVQATAAAAAVQAQALEQPAQGFG